MITPDSLPVWFAIPTIVLGWSWLIAVTVRWFRTIPLDPDPQYSKLDCLDGLDSRTG